MPGPRMNVKAIAVGVVVLAVCLVFAADAGASTILNGNFETGDFSDWTTVPAPEGSLFFVGGNPRSGSYAAWFGAIGILDENISQTFETTPGQSYVIDFWLAHGATDSANDFGAFWDGVPMMELVNANTFSYNRYTFLETALGTSSTLRFSGREVLDYYYVDDVSVTNAEAATLANPEPASLLLVGTGMAGLVRARRRHRDRVA